MKKYFKFLIPLVVILNFATNMNYAIIQVPTENEIQKQEVDRLQKIKEKRVLTVLSPNEEPHSYQDTKTGQFSGIDADIIQEIAKRLGVKEVVVRYVSFTNALQELMKNSELDLMASEIFITDERKQLVNFTNPIYTDSDAILT